MTRASTAIAEKQNIIHHGRLQNFDVLHTQKNKHVQTNQENWNQQKQGQKKKSALVRSLGMMAECTFIKSECHISTRVLGLKRDARIQIQCSVVVVPKHRASNLAKLKP
jgi:hypothetical protein